MEAKQFLLPLTLPNFSQQVLFACLTEAEQNMSSSEYVRSLTFQDRESYLKKFTLTNGSRPYTLTQWMDELSTTAIRLGDRGLASRSPLVFFVRFCHFILLI